MDLIFTWIDILNTIKLSSLSLQSTKSVGSVIWA
jgi:hypothetical protein